MTNAAHSESTCRNSGEYSQRSQFYQLVIRILTPGLREGHREKKRNWRKKINVIKSTLCLWFLHETLNHCDEWPVIYLAFSLWLSMGTDQMRGNCTCSKSSLTFSIVTMETRQQWTLLVHYRWLIGNLPKSNLHLNCWEMQCGGYLWSASNIPARTIWGSKSGIKLLLAFMAKWLALLYVVQVILVANLELLTARTQTCREVASWKMRQT